VETAVCHQQPLAVPHQVADQLAGVLFMHDGTHRDRHHEISARLASTVSAPAVFTALRREFPVMPEVHQRVDTGVRCQPDTAAIPTVTAIRAAERDVFLAPETDDAVSAVTGLDVDIGFVDKFHRGIIPSANKKAPPERGFGTVRASPAV
jgi:hypothetical protein